MKACLLLASTLACSPATGGGSNDDDDDDVGPNCSDQDGDGYGGGADCLGRDCDDTDPGRNTGCGEDCDMRPESIGCPCGAASDPVPCYMGPDGTEAVGDCRAGTRGCLDGFWSTCDAQILPHDEVCDHRDTDCDGEVDEGVTEPDGTCGDQDCEERSRWVYVLTSDDWLVRFEPDELSFTEIGRLDCDAPAGWKPYSMGVSRDGTAYVHFRDLESPSGAGELFRVSTDDASCESLEYSPPDGFASYGMGFSSNSEGGTDETLFIGGGDGTPGLGTASLGSLDLGDFSATSIGMLPSWPELTGTGSAELWAFLPNESPMQIARLDKSNADALQSFDLPIGGIMTQAWAFAFWGGRFWIFHQDLVDPSSKVYSLEPGSGDFAQEVGDTDMQISGAGVSTCAPVELI